MTTTTTERDLTRQIDALENEKGQLVYAWIAENNDRDALHGNQAAWTAAWDAAEKATAGRKREILNLQRDLRAERKAIKDAAKAEREARIAASKRERAEARDRVTVECQVCAGRYCATGAGALVHHGYTRPGDGFIHGDCWGVGYKAYPETDGLVAYVEALGRQAAAVASALLALPERQEFHDVRESYGRNYQVKREVVVTLRGDAGWDRRYALAVSTFEREAEAIASEITRANDRIAAACGFATVAR